MRLAIVVLLIAHVAVGQTKQCKDNYNNVYTDGPCEMYRSCEWSGRKYRAQGRCWKVDITAAEKVGGEFHREVIELCNDKTNKPRSCQQEFNKRDEDENVESCLDRRIQAHHSEFVRQRCGQMPSGCGWGGDEEKSFVDQMILSDRTAAARECAPPK